MADLQQWNVVCTICESPVEFHCNTCGDRLCSKCKAIHLKSGASKHHSIVPYMEGLAPSKQMKITCSQHKGNQSEFWCKTCDKAICSTCVMSSAHVGHTFGSIADKVQEKKTLMTKELERRSATLVAWKGRLEDAKKLTLGYAKGVEVLDEQLNLGAEQLHLEVKKILSSSRQQLDNFKSSDLVVLQSQESNLTLGINGIQEGIKEIEDQLRSDDITKILYYLDNDQEQSPPDLTIVPLPDFKSGLSNVEGLSEIFGRLSARGTKADSQQKTTTTSHLPTERTGKSQMQNVDSNKAESKRSTKQMTLKTKPLEIATLNDIQFHSCASTLFCSEENQTWIRTGERVLEMIDIDGSVKKINTHECDITEMTLASGNYFLFTDSQRKQVLSLSTNGNIQLLFRTFWQPRLICSMRNGNILLSLQGHQVVEYDRAGKVIMKIDNSKFKQDIVCIGENEVNSNLYVCVYKYHYHSGYGKLLAFESNGNLRFEYPSRDDAGCTKVQPRSMVADNMGHVLVVAFHNLEKCCKIHVLDKDGNFLQYLVEQGNSWDAIDVDGEGHCWLKGGSTLKILKYLK